MSEALFSNALRHKAEAFAQREHGMLIGGQWRPAASGKTLDTFNPATKTHLGTIASAGPEDVDHAAQAAQRAYREVWSRQTPEERQRLLWRLSDRIESCADELAVLETLDSGKPVRDARMMDISHSISMLRYYAGWATKLNGETIAVSRPGQWHSYTLHQPFAVAGLIVPWNAPIMMAIGKLAPALAAGCCVILKPAELTSLTALRIGELACEAGFPDGVINVVTGLGSVAGQAIVDHPTIEKISFTGSGAIGRSIMVAGARHMKRVTLELGGKSPVVIMRDAELDEAIGSAARGIFANAGQTCIAGSRVYVHADVYDRVLDGIVSFAKGLVLGDGMQPETQMGPLVSDAQLARVRDYIEAGRQEGAAVVTGGNALEMGGHFCAPTVLAQTRQDMRVVREEIFGPVLCVQRFDDTMSLDGIAQLANDTDYGLGAMLWTRDLSTAHKLAATVKAGTVRINGGGLDPALPFGGFGHSGVGRESGREGIEAFTEKKSIIIAL
ncbi:aldehyde dehydrogenase family protein [Bradyrhizobium jicamae]|uniref:Aldehyde dehydrogenase family protein n=1 Tax=Bradyrhizobium jicamae TaxID=280332 RepID=A0ABS5FUY1_9BRAD|nr:aldehyde dehydrogenase family protein [Bradyrhizobium jicamae]MBR0800424.1 aldehyde dehydrogenase family protein [Bradyrhizobium jicamae]